MKKKGNRLIKKILETHKHSNFSLKEEENSANTKNTT